MGSTVQLVKYTRLFQQGPLTPAQKQDLKNQINAIIDQATNTITIEAMVVPSDVELREEVEKRGL
jgi:CRISPR/Cas system-associated endoribonuclease Cas2